MAEGGGLLNRYTVKSRIGGSNPPLSAILDYQQLTQDTGPPHNGFACQIQESPGLSKVVNEDAFAWP